MLCIRNMCVVLIVGTVVPAILHGQEPVPGKPAYLTKGDMHARIEAIRSRIEDLTVEFSFDAVGPTPSNYLGAHNSATVTVKGTNTYYRCEYGAAGSSTFFREAAYNGKESTYHTMDGRAMIWAERRRETETRGQAFFDMMLMNPPQPDGDGLNDQSLLSLLKTPHSRVRPNHELVSGRACHVIDLVRFKWVQMTVWLDAERGFLPIRQHYLRPDGSRTMEFIIEEAMEVNEGMWFAIRGRKLVSPALEVGGRPPAFENVLEVKGWREGHPAIVVNAGFTDEFFDLWKRLPPGTIVDNYSTRKRWTVGATGPEALAAVATHDGQAPEPHVRHMPAKGSRQWTDWMVPLVTACIVGGVGLLLARRIRRGRHA